MKSCVYIYCNEELEGSETICPSCGTEQTMQNPANELRSKIELEYLIDMHQILPKVPGILALQRSMMVQLSIRKALIQSVPDLVQSISNNKDLRALKADHPNQFHISHFMDPRHPIARKKIRRYAKNGIKVIKLLPCLGYNPDHSKYDRFWKTMEAQQQIAMVHTGFITARHKAEEKKNNTYLNSQYGHPVYFDRIARKFPKLQIILCHIGGAMWYEEAIQMINQHDNVWGDCSGFGNFALDRLLRNKVKVNWSKIFWGNDSHPKQYFTNLNIFLSVLKKHGRNDLQKKLLQTNGETFMNKFID